MSSVFGLFFSMLFDFPYVFLLKFVDFYGRQPTKTKPSRKKEPIMHNCFIFKIRYIGSQVYGTPVNPVPGTKVPGTTYKENMHNWFIFCSFTYLAFHKRNTTKSFV